MIMIVKSELCTGCGACVNACSMGAILLKDNIAFVDQEKCSSCEICVEACPTGALQLSRIVSPVNMEKPRAIEVLQPQAAMESSPKQTNWSGVILLFVSQHLLPRLVDVLAVFLERRLAQPVQECTSMTMNSVRNRPYHRRRQRRGRNSKI
jgi:Fe-S-cluster-containing hydrogenase component 2